ncbi:MAG TPA: AsmA-like C-terminal domain-containing protein [Stellaceae bacterium]|nr:AsmA-like C-terminal domain-containing protein [Stellaceae bacterium]
MIRHIVWQVVRWLGGLVAALGIMAAFLIWRLSSGPLSLDTLAPYVAAALADAESGFTARVDHTLVSLGPRSTIEVVARGIHLARRSDGAALTLPEIALGLSTRAALAGVFAPTRIVLQQPELRLQRAEDGTFRLGLGSETPSADDSSEELLRDLTRPPNRRGALGYLVEVAVRQAALTVDDRALGVVWQANRVDISLFRGAAGVSGEIALAVQVPGGGQTGLQGDFRYAYGDARLSTQIEFSAFTPAMLADTAPALAPLASLQLPFGGVLRLELDTSAWRVDDAWCDVTLGSGRITHEALRGGEVAVASGRLRAAYDPVGGRVSVESVALDLGGPRLEVSGAIEGVGGGILAGGLPNAIDVVADLKLIDLPVDDLPRLWPEKLSPRTRSWMAEHIHDGVAGATVHLGAHVDFAVDAQPPVKLVSLDGSLLYRGLTVEYFKPLPPLRGVEGNGTFDRAHLDLVPSVGSVKGVHLAGGTAKLYKLDTDDEQITIDLGLQGPLRDVLEVLDSKPLQYARELKVDPARVGGGIDGRVAFTFPLKHDLTLAMVDYGASATMNDVSVGQILFGRDLDRGDLRLKLDRTALRVDGTARVAEVPTTLSWAQSLRARDAVRASYTIKARIDDAARRRLDLDYLPNYVNGPIEADLAYSVMAGGRARAVASLDLAETTLDVAVLNWHKPPGTAAKASFELELVDDRVRAIRDIAVRSAGLDAKAMMTFSADDGAAEIARIEVQRLVAGETDLSGSVVRRPEGGWRLEAKGSCFDASNLAREWNRPSTDTENAPPLVIDMSVDRLILGPNREARTVSGQLFSDGNHWQTAVVEATLLSGKKLSIRLGQAAGDRNFRILSDDYGGVLKLFGISENVVGGELTVTGQVDDSGGRRLLRGKADGADYRIVGAPALARLLSVASFSGIGALLSGEGIPFTRLKADFTLVDGKLAVTDMRAYGGAIGINANGVYDLNADTLDVSGTLVPAYTLNSVIGNIPVLGKLLMGGEGEGLFGANFRVAGPASDTKVTVNPLSALAPGVLRKLFLFDAPDPGQTPPAPPPKSIGNYR